jgi:membrane protein YqaA with SNARE-associated domain
MNNLEDSKNRFVKSFSKSKENIQKGRKRFGKGMKKSKKNLEKRIKRLRKIDVVIFFLIVISAIAVIFFLKDYDPKQIVDYSGVENIYLTIFFFAIIGGVSFLTATYFYITFFLFIAGGANPLLLALSVGIGLTIGDLFFYFVGLRGSPILENYFKRKENLKKIGFIQNKMKKYEFWTIYLYVGFLPFPKDIISFTLGFFGHRLKNIIIPLLLGNFTYNVLIAYLFLFGFV